MSSSGRSVSLPVPDDETGTKRKSAGVQLQNIPRSLKAAITSRRSGWSYFDCDGAQIEFRVAGDLTQDEVVLSDIRNKVDVHAFTASRLTAAGEPTSRQDAKASTFKPLYGGSKGTKAVEAYCESFKEKYHKLAKTQELWTKEVLNTGELRTRYGMVYRWPDTKLQKSGYITNTTNIYNFPIQGLATAEIIPIVIVHAWHRLRGMDAFLNMTVHDSISGEKSDEIDDDEFRKIIACCFTVDVYRFMERCYNYKMVVPLAASIKIGSHCGSGKEYEATVAPENLREIEWKIKG